MGGEGRTGRLTAEDVKEEEEQEGSVIYCDIAHSLAPIITFSFW